MIKRYSTDDMSKRTKHIFNSDFTQLSKILEDTLYYEEN